MNVAFVNSTKEWGGVKTWCLDMGSALQKRGGTSHVFGRPGAFVDKAAALGMQAHAIRFGSDFSPKMILYFARYFRRHRIGLVVLNISKELRTAGVAARLLGIPTVQHIGSPKDMHNTRIVRFTQRLVGAKMVCCSEYVRRGILLSLPLLEKYDTAALHPGTLIPEFPEREVNQPPVIIATSRLHQAKRHEDLLQALAMLRDEKVPFRAVIVGTGTEEKTLHALCTSLNLDGLVEWTGFTTDVQAHLQRSDIFVLPSRCEALGIALEEAMASGLAPVARAAGGVPEIWPPQCSEYLIPPDQGAEGFHQALKKLLLMPPQELLELRRAAWNHARQAFSLETQADRFFEWAVRSPAA